ncbi:MAG: alpha-xylosidase, partial [Lachnospiraceae bacterium]|nr:alpha-xylosidase [Lachnospiraceae bacterium]
MGKLFGFNAVPLADESAVIQGDKYRITVLTSRMLRLEYSEDGIFEDRATQIVLNRRFPVPQFRVIKKEEGFELVTDSLLLSYNGKEFSSSGLSIQVNGNLSAYRSTWFYGEEYKDLKGTARTLDEADGEVELDRGLLSYYGFSLIDDSKSTIIREDGWVEPRKKGCKDIYFLGYGRDYLGCLKDFYKLSGPTPMIPRYALGNWWSRFYWYTEKEYKELYTRFMKEDIPFSVAVLDMCWHITDVDPKYGSGWTGYTWNKELLPDPEGFMKWLHENNMRITLNVHPADGVRGFEEMYADMAAELGVDADREDKINFDVADRSFLESYFRNIYHRNEKRGVDFWWIDWQQQGGSKVEGIDAQWMLNHYHYLDNGREGKKPLILSRYAGLGSHRYPVGFSGDTFATWDSLDFQPYFTANASNAGYGWWSHDIGGHMHGTRSDEMAMRWLQFGVFSP